jgi:hypothetical protein
MHLRPWWAFGWLLLVLLAQCLPEQRLLRFAYILSFFLILLFSEIPWVDLLVRGVDGG